MAQSHAARSEVQIRVEGIVQGVNYRASARRKARELGIDAEPVNLNDGSVRITASGAPESIERFVEWCHKGPPMAEVTSVTVTEEP